MNDLARHEDSGVTVAVVGLGAMGSRIAGRFLDAGHTVVVWNRHPGKTVSLVQRGATEASSPAEAAELAHVVVTMVRDAEALREVTEGRSGVAAGANGLTAVIQMSTVEPAALSRLASMLKGRAQLLDAPVLGSVSEAEAGTLTIFVGGDSAAVEQWTPSLSTLGCVMHVGPLGAGTAAKLVANSTLFGVLGVLGEALALAERLGLSRDLTFEVLGATPLAVQATRRRAAIEAGVYPARFALSLARKDADLILAAADASSIQLRVAGAARAWLAEAEEAGAGAHDYTAVLAQILRAASADARDVTSSGVRRWSAARTEVT